MARLPLRNQPGVGSRRRLIVDCDPGIDDAVAIALCGASAELELLGITVTHGNVSLAQTTENALGIVNLLGLDVAVFAGAERPLVCERIAPYSDVANGLGGLQLPRHGRVRMPGAPSTSLSKQ